MLVSDDDDGLDLRFSCLTITPKRALKVTGTISQDSSAESAPRGLSALLRNRSEELNLRCSGGKKSRRDRKQLRRVEIEAEFEEKVWYTPN